MISVLIVDDEYLIRKLVRNSIEWDALQMEVVGEAENGEEAIQFLQRNQVDIAIVDINMPFVNGVDFAEYVYRNHLQTKVILLTGYREFEYAQQAIRWKVVGYLLKPLQIPEMERTLREIVSTYYRNKRKLSPGEMEQAQLREYANNLSEELPESCARLSPFFAVVLRIDGAGRLDGLRGELTFLCDNFFRPAAASLQERAEAPQVCGYVEYDSYVALFIHWEGGEEEAARLRLVDAAREQIRRQRGYTLTAGISSVFQDQHRLDAALQEALDAASCRFYHSADRTYSAGEVVDLDYSTRLRISSQINALLAAAGERSAADRQTCRSLLGELLDGFQAEQVNEDYVKMTVLQFLLALYAGGGEIRSHSQKSIYRITACERFSKFREEVERIFLAYLEPAGSETERAVSLSPLTARVRQYIDNQFADRDICLNSIAANVYANPTYISNQFKKEMGLTITEYITACRMKKAQQLISTGMKTSLQELADAVGYNDPYYFSKSFKKYYGTTPSRYLIERG